MSIKEKMQKQFGSKALDRVIKAGELFDVVDGISDAFQSLKARVMVLETQAGITQLKKPTVRVKATARQQ